MIIWVLSNWQLYWECSHWKIGWVPHCVAFYMCVYTCQWCATIWVMNTQVNATLNFANIYSDITTNFNSGEERWFSTQHTLTWWRIYGSVSRVNICAILVCSLFGAEPLTDPILTYCQLDHREQSKTIFGSKYIFLKENAFEIWSASYQPICSLDDLFNRFIFQ